MEIIRMDADCKTARTALVTLELDDKTTHIFPVSRSYSIAAPQGKDHILAEHGETIARLARDIFSQFDAAN